jgi:hypothetical protein
MFGKYHVSTDAERRERVPGIFVGEDTFVFPALLERLAKDADVYGLPRRRYTRIAALSRDARCFNVTSGYFVAREGFSIVREFTPDVIISRRCTWTE